MTHVKALAIKLIVHFVLGFIILGIIFVAPINDALIAAVIVAVLTYIVGDLLILRKGGNIPATLVDAATAFVFTWIYLNIMAEGDFLVAGFVFAIAIGIFESLFHNWLLNNVVPDERSMK